MMKAIIFDLDGVLVFTDKFHFLAWKQLADKLGIYFDEEINNRLRGVSRMESLDIILERSTIEYSLEEKVKFATQKNDIYREYLLKMDETDVDTKTRNTLLTLKKLGYKIAIGSSSKNTPLILKQTKLDIFDAVSDGNNISKSKPDPEVFLKAAEMLNVKPEEAYIVEDAESGIIAGKDGGFKTIAIGNNINNNLEDYHIDKFEDILKIINK